MARRTLNHAPFHQMAERPRADRVGLVACFFAAVLVLSFSWSKLSSLDIGYHVGYGRHFLETGQIVGTVPDPFLWTETGVPFVNANWGSQVVMAFFERAGGAAGLTLLRTGLILIIFGAMAVVVRSASHSWSVVAWAWALAAFGAYERFSMRPELMSCAVMLLQLAIWVRGVRSWKGAAALVGLQILWANLHSYFLVGVILAGAFWGEAGWAYLNRRRIFGDVRTMVVGRFKLITITVALMAAACAIHPWGIRGALFPLQTLSFLQDQQVMGNAAGESGQSAMAEISEFESPFARVGERINHVTITAYFVLIAVGFVGICILGYQRRFGWVIAILLMFAMSTQMRRNIAQFSLIAAPLTLAAVGSIPWSNLFSVGQRRNFGMVGAAILSTGCGLFSWQVATGRLYLSELRVTREFGYGYLDRTFPKAAMEWLAKQTELQPQLFVDYFSSSNVIPWLPDRLKLYVDTNTFAYRDETLRTAFDLGYGKLPHGPFFDQHGVNVVLLHCGSDTQMLVRAMMQDDGNWSLVYADPVAVIFIRRIQAQVEVILGHQLSESKIDSSQWIKSAGDGADATRAMTIGTMGNVPMSLGWYKTAVEILDEAVRLAPQFDEARHFLGVAHLNLGNAAARKQDYADAVRHWKIAKSCFERVIAGTPNHKDAPNALEMTRRLLSAIQR